MREIGNQPTVTTFNKLEEVQTTSSPANPPKIDNKSTLLLSTKPVSQRKTLSLGLNVKPFINPVSQHSQSNFTGAISETQKEWMLTKSKDQKHTGPQSSDGQCSTGFLINTQTCPDINTESTLPKQVYVKVAHNQSQADFLENEWNTLQSMEEHPGIVKCLGFHREGNHKARLFIEGHQEGSLSRQITKQDNSANLEEVLKVMALLSKTILHVHNNEKTHYDLHTDNVVFNHNLEPVLIDFGMARQTSKLKYLKDQNRIQENSLGFPLVDEKNSQIYRPPLEIPPNGQSSYLAPECLQFEGGTFSDATDVYGIGQIGLAMLTGKPKVMSWQKNEKGEIVDIFEKTQGSEDDIERQVRDRFAGTDHQLKLNPLITLIKSSIQVGHHKRPSIKDMVTKLSELYPVSHHEENKLSPDSGISR